MAVESTGNAHNDMCFKSIRGPVNIYSQYVFKQSYFGCLKRIMVKMLNCYVIDAIYYQEKDQFFFFLFCLEMF